MRAREIFENYEIEEMALPPDWDESQLGHDKTFAKRLAYAKERALQTGTGSSRTAFIIPDNGRDTVVKIAKNRKGLAQNKVEVAVLNDGYIGRLPIVIPLIDYDKKNPVPIWLQTEKANKVTEKKLVEMLGCVDVWDLYYAVKDILNLEVEPFAPDLDKVLAKLEKNGKSKNDIERFLEYAHEVADLVNSSGTLIIDLMSQGNWGEYNGRLVVIDVGFNKEVQDKHYS
jgi:hypothetical protein